MESSEDDRGAARDAVDQPSTRENTEMLSGGEESRSLLTSSGAGGEALGSMDRGAHSSFAVDEDGCHNTETILNMIDEFIDEPKATKSTKYTADSTVCERTPPREPAVSSGTAYQDRLTDNCVAIETAQGGVESSQNVTASGSIVKDKHLEDMVNDISSSSTNQGASGSGCSESRIDVVDSNTTCDPVESCSKAESLPGQRRKLIRPTLPKEVTKLNMVACQEGHSSLEEPEDKEDTGGCNETPTQSSPKKVKLVRHSSVKAKPLVVTNLPSATSLQVDSSSGPPPEQVKDRLQCHTQSSCNSDVITKPTDAHSPRESSVNAHQESDSGSVVKELPSVNKLDSSEVKLTNSLNNVSEVCEDNKSNEVLDVRKVSPLRLSRSTIEESLNSKNNTTKHNIEVQQNDIGNQPNLDECKNIPKLTLKLGSKYNEDGRGCNKISRLNIKPLKEPEGLSDMPACSKAKHTDEEHSESEHNVPNVIKLNIKPIHKPDDVEGDTCKDSKSSSSSSETECESSENEVLSECIQSPTVETTECDQGRSVPKLTIKSLSTVPKVDCESHKHKVGRRSQSPEPLVVSKLHIKPIIPPPIEKMTIKLNKSHESESKCETESSHVESVPKMTIKLGKSQETATVLENNCDDDKVDCALKMKIKLGKSVENSVDINSDSPSEHCPVTRSSKRLIQKQEHIAEQHVPKLTIKIPQEHESKSSEKSTHSPSIPKLTIKPIIKPEEIERSSSPTVPKLTIKPIPKPEEHDTRGDENVEQPTIPKLTIRPILKPDDHNVERCPSPTITKLNIKPVVKPDELESKLSDTTDSHGVPKLTIKAIKPDDHDTRHNEGVSSSIPKLTIKPVIKPDDVERESQIVPKLTIKHVMKPDEHTSEAETPTVPKLTIKPIVKPDESAAETETPCIPKLTIKPIIKPGDVCEVETITVPKITIKPVVKYDENDLKHSQGPSSPSIPKLTIKPVNKPDDSKTDSSDVPSVRKLTIKNIHKAEEQELRRSERCLSPNVPKLTIKPAEVPVVHKLTIKPVLKPEEQPLQEPSNTISKSVSKSVIEPEDDDAVTKISIKPIPKPVDNEVVDRVVEKPEEVTIRTRSKASLEETISKLNSKTKSVSETYIELSNDLVVVATDPSAVKLTMQSVPEDLIKPLEITTSPAKSSPSHQASGLDSPRIILKINKCAQGSVSEVLIDESQHKNNEPSVTTELSNSIEPPKSPEKEITAPAEDIVKEPPVENQEDTVVTKEEVIEEKPLNDLKTEELNDKMEDTNETSKENDEQLLKPGYKRTRARESTLNKYPDKGSLALKSKRQKLVNAIANLHNKNKRNASITIPLNSSKEESITSNKSTSNSCSEVNDVSANNGESNFNDIHSNKNSNDGDSESTNSFAKINENSTVVEGDSNTTSTRGSDDTTSEINQHGTDSPIFNKVDRNILVLNDETNSQECMMIDELSQDPLDIESAAKSHFTPVTASTTPVMSIKDTIKIVQQTPMEIAETLGLSQAPKRRGRPRKNPVPENQTPTPVKPPSEPKTYPKLPTPALEERPVRVLRTPRDRPAILRTPRARGGRGRGGNRRGGSNSNTRDVGTSPPDSPVDKAIKFFDLSNTTLESAAITPCKVDVSRLVREESGGEDEEEEEIVKSVRGRGSGRVSRRGGRRSRGGARGKGSRGGIMKGGQRGEEIQLQDALPLASPLGRREGRKSRLEPTLTPALQVFEEETCMIGDNATPKRNISLVDEESQSSVLSGQTASESGTRSVKRPKLMDMLDEGHKEWTPADVAEYDWPPEGTNCRGEPSQTVMIQEQVALYLGVKSFKRRYPDLKRRALSAEEKNYIRDRGLISEALCDLGVTAVDAGEVLDIMFTDYPEKYEEYRKHLRERRETKPTATPASKPMLAPQPAKQSVSRQEILEKACESAASWNAQLNKQRKTQRPASMDLQTLTLHKPRRPPVVQEPNPSALSFYPVALLPGQFTDFYRNYTPEELRYFPLNTVMDLLPSPKPVVESSSEESDSNSDSEHSSGAESDSETSTIETNSRRKAPLVKGKARQSIANASRPVSPSIDSTPVKTESETAASSTAASDIPNKCKLCEGSEFANKRNPNEAFITCATCKKKIHPSCLDMSPSVTKCVRGYAWQCADCKCCGQCGDLADDDKMLFCDLCDRGYHIYCVGLKKVPTGRWHCAHCALCRSCGSRSPSGPQGVEPPGPEAPADQWHHHFKRTNAGQRVYSHTLCAPCAKAWSLGLFCPSCERCFVGRKGAMGLVICVRCDRRYHQECIRQVRKSLDVLNFMCSNCRRGVNPKHKLRRAERTPRKSLQAFADSSMHSIVTDSNSSMQNNSSNMDQGGDSSSALDSMLPSPSSISDLPLNNLKARVRQSEDLDEYGGDGNKNSASKDIDFKTATRRLFSVDDTSIGGSIPSNMSEYRIPSTSRIEEKRTEDKSEKNSGDTSPENTNASEPQDPLETPENVEGGA